MQLELEKCNYLIWKLHYQQFMKTREGVELNKFFPCVLSFCFCTHFLNVFQNETLDKSLFQVFFFFYIKIKEVRHVWLTRH